MRRVLVAIICCASLLACGDTATVSTKDAPRRSGDVLPAAVQPALSAPLAFLRAVEAGALFTATVTFNAELERQKIERAAVVPHHPPRPPARSPQRSTYGSGACGGDLPSCSILACESGGSLTARNSSGAAGKWQIMPGTWGGYGGYSSADQAPESVQDARAREIWAGGRGRGQWVCR